MPEHLVHLELLHLVLDPTLSCVDFPSFITNGEPVLLIHCDLGLHDQPTAEQDIENIWRTAKLVDCLVRAIFLLAEITVKLLDYFGGPILESGHPMQVLQPLCLLHVLYVEDLVVEIGLIED